MGRIPLKIAFLKVVFVETKQAVWKMMSLGVNHSNKLKLLF